MASLAVANTPEWMTFVLVDYKGGAAFKDCVGLPHTVGMVTDLDSHLVERALASLGAELAFRERVLATAGAKDLEDYVVQRERQTSLPVLPRLLIVIDEFASLVRELPDFVDGLVNIAQRGRSWVFTCFWPRNVRAESSHRPFEPTRTCASPCA